MTIELMDNSANRESARSAAERASELGLNIARHSAYAVEITIDAVDGEAVSAEYAKRMVNIVDRMIGRAAVWPIGLAREI
jgi:hypothetical protein